MVRIQLLHQALMQEAIKVDYQELRALVPQTILAPHLQVALVQTAM